MDINKLGGDAQAIIETVERLANVGALTLSTGDQVAAVPSAIELVDLKPFIDKYRTKPERIETIAAATSAESFIDYLRRFAKPATAVFAIDDPAAPKLLGMIDYHGQGDAAEPSFCTHRIVYPLELSDEWHAWSGATDKGAMSQEEFAFFLQSRSHDIANPPVDWMAIEGPELDTILDILNLHDDQGDVNDSAAAEVLTEAGEENDERYVPRSAIYKLRRIRWGSVQRLIQMARSIEISANAKATAGYNPRTGERQVSFVEEHEAADSRGRRVFVPDAFFLNIPVFEGGERHLVPVRLYYRLVGGQLKWWFELVDPRRMVRLAVRQVVAEVALGTGVPVFYGHPEGGDDTDD